MKNPTCPKNKALFSATTPDGEHTVTRTSARDYTHAVAIFSPAEPHWEDRRWLHLDLGETIPEGFEVIYHGQRNGGIDKNTVFVGRRVADLPDRWSIWAFSGSAANADKAGRGFGRIYRVVEAKIVADRRVQKGA